ncbi:MAG: redox-regulated ATPase YchF, partial [Clostridia bacterium]|nr:redox-regulated ATPase YchF [Clostridia bacterium]
LVKGASRGEGLGNKFLSHIRQVDAIVHVVRCFEDTNIIHVEGSVDPVRDVETINLELIFADMEMVENRTDKVRKMAKSGEKKYKIEVEFLEKLYAHLESGKPARSFDLSEDDAEFMKEIDLLTKKPIIYAANVAEDDFVSGIENNDFVKRLTELADAEGAEVMPISAKIEEDISALDPEEKDEYLQELGINESGLDRLVKKSYKLLGLISYLTAGEPEVRAWTITNGMKAPQAAGKIHTDFEKGFIRAEVVAYNDLMDCGSMVAAKEKGLVRSEGKEYVVADGDIILFRFNV